MFACCPTRRALRSRMLSERNLPYVPYVRDLESGHSLNLRHTPFTGSGEEKGTEKTHWYSRWWLKGGKASSTWRIIPVPVVSPAVCGPRSQMALSIAHKWRLCPNYLLFFLKLTCSHLKLNGWKMTHVLVRWLLLLVSGRVGMILQGGSHPNKTLLSAGVAASAAAWAPGK